MSTLPLTKRRVDLDYPLPARCGDHGRLFRGWHRLGSATLQPRLCAGRLGSSTPRARWNFRLLKCAGRLGASTPCALSKPELLLTIDPGREPQSLGHIAASTWLGHSAAMRAGIDLARPLCPRYRSNVCGSTWLGHSPRTLERRSAPPCTPDDHGDASMTVAP